MEKLIELLENWDWRNVTYNKQSDWGYMFRLGDLAFREERICSKKFWFIKWLVENDKIDLDAQAMQYAKSDLSKFFTEWEDENWMSDDYAMLLMLLSIQDEPINFLVSILK